MRSLGRRTDFIFAKFSGSVTDRGAYTLIQTPSNPEYHWGNYIVFGHAPQRGSLKEWTAIFDREFGYYPEPHHYVFTWDTDHQEEGEFQEFLDANFTMDSAAVLTTKKLNLPPYVNDRVEVKKIQSDQDWAKVVQLQIQCADSKFANEHFEKFKHLQMGTYRKMSEAGMGFWFGAYIDGKLVGDLGIFFEGEFARYQSVETHPNFRKLGVCGNLVYQAGQIAFEEFAVSHLVMEADVDYHAARIYESVGFKRNEVNHSLSWWRGGKSDG